MSGQDVDRVTEDPGASSALVHDVDLHPVRAGRGHGGQRQVCPRPALHFMAIAQQADLRAQREPDLQGDSKASANRFSHDFLVFVAVRTEAEAAGWVGQIIANEAMASSQAMKDTPAVRLEISPERLGEDDMRVDRAEEKLVGEKDALGHSGL